MRLRQAWETWQRLVDGAGTGGGGGGGGDETDAAVAGKAAVAVAEKEKRLKALLARSQAIAQRLREVADEKLLNKIVSLLFLLLRRFVVKGQRSVADGRATAGGFPPQRYCRPQGNLDCPLFFPALRPRRFLFYNPPPSLSPLKDERASLESAIRAAALSSDFAGDYELQVRWPPSSLFAVLWISCCHHLRQC